MVLKQTTHSDFFGQIYRNKFTRAKTKQSTGLTPNLDRKPLCSAPGNNSLLMAPSASSRLNNGNCLMPLLMPI